MPNFVTIAGVNEALANIAYNPDTQKARLLELVRSYFSDQDSLNTITSIPPEEIVRRLWQTDDPDVIKAKRKSLSSLKSSINKDLKALTDSDGNPEGIVLNRDNVFTVSEEKKNNILQELGVTPGSINPIRDLFTSLRKMVSEMTGAADVADFKELLDELEETRKTIRKLGNLPDDQGQGEQQGATGNGAGPDENTSGNDYGGSAENYAEGSGDEIEILTEDDVEFIDTEEDDFEDEIIAEDSAATVIEEEIAEDELLQEELAVPEEAEDFELVADESEFLSEDEVELVDDSDDDRTDHKPTPKRRLLEVLSDYLEPEQALQEMDILSEEQEEYISRILKRFTPAFVRIPGGRYQIGCPLPAPSEHQVREITVASFHIGQHPVTNDLFELFVRDTGYETEAEKSGFGIVYEGQYSSGKDMISGLHTLTIRKGATAGRVEGANWRYPSGPGKGSISGKHSHPVVQVSHQDALAFAAWAGKRLPTEEEWEAAARGTGKHPYPWGRDWHDSLGNFSSSRLGDTAPADRSGREAASPFGVCDLLGNVYEWTATLHNPANGRSRPAYILKGGGWTTSGPVSISHRLIETNIWSNIIGFRCAV